MTYKKAQKVEVAFIDQDMGTTEEVLANQDLTYHELPIENAFINWDSELTFNALDQPFESNLRGLLTWDITCDVLFKGSPGYLVTLYREELDSNHEVVKEDVPSDATWEDEGDNWWKLQIPDVDRFFLLPDTVTFSNSVEEFDPLFARVKSSDEPQIESGQYVPIVSDGNVETFTLQHETEPVNTSVHDISGQKGYGQRQPGTLYTESSPEGQYTANTPLFERLEYARRNSPLLVEYDTGVGSQCRGFFRILSLEIGEDIGEHDMFSAEMQIANPNFGQWRNSYPIMWYHGNQTTLQEPLRKLIDTWLNKERVVVKLTTMRGKEFTGKAFVETFSLEGNISESNTISLQFRGTDNLV